MYKKFDDYLRRKPGVYLLFLLTVMVVVQLVINITRQQPMGYNMQNPLSVGFYFLLAYGIYSAKLKKRTQAVVGLGIMFSYLIISSWFDKSMVDYTSIIVAAGVALICTFFLMVIIWSLERNAERLK